MKKYLFLLMISGLLISCNNVSTEKNEKAYVVEESTLENKYTTFEKENLEKYGDLGVTGVEVAPYSKGIDILFTTNQKDFTKENFDKIAEECVKRFKESYGFGEEMEIGVSLDYQPTPEENVISLFNTKLK